MGLQAPHENAAVTEYRDIYFDRATGKTYIYRRSDGSMGTWEDQVERPSLKFTETPYTFEAATWSGTFDWITSRMWPWLNPLGFATKDTARQIQQLCADGVLRYMPSTGLAIYVSDEDRITGPFRRTVELLIRVENHKMRQHAEFSAGRIAERIIRHGEEKAMLDWLFEIKASGVA